MTVSMLLSWCAVLFVLLDALRYIARISQIPVINRFFHKIHIPAGIIALICSFLHGLLAGNVSGEKIKLGTALFSLNLGTLCFILMLLLIISCHLKKLIPGKWMMFHRILTVLLAVMLAFHIWDMGIHIFDRPGKADRREEVTYSVSFPPESQAEEKTEETSLSEPAGEQTFSAAESPDGDGDIQAMFSGAALLDGVYTGSARGHQSNITVKVTVEKGQVVSIDVLEQNETKKYFSHAMSVLDDVIRQQSLDVDAVTGATYSSAGLLNAVRDALNDAVIEGEL